MWAEARKHEKKIRGMMVDHRKRAERRREYYEKIKADPTQFLQVHGRRCKIHLDPAIAAVADSPATMMPWQGKTDCMIDRFDGRAHLDIIREYKTNQVEADPEKFPWEERQANYERYRIVVQNDFLGIQEEKFLHQIYLEEHFGISYNKAEEEKKKVLASKKAAIGYNYDEDAASNVEPVNEETEEQTEAGEEDLEDIDLDLSIAVDALSTEQMHNLNQSGQKFGLGHQDFMSLLTNDLSEQEELRLARIEAEEKIAMQGKRTRRERRILKDLRLATRNTSPPSYATRSSPVYGSGSPRYERSDGAGFGDDSDAEGKAAEASAFIEAIPLVESPKRKKSSSRSPSFSPQRRPITSRRSPQRKRSRTRSPVKLRKLYTPSPSRSRSRSAGRSRKIRSRSRGRRSRTPEKWKGRSRSRSRRRSRTRSRDRWSRSKSRQKDRRRSYSRSRSVSRGKDTKRSSKHYSGSRSPSPRRKTDVRDRKLRSISRDRRSWSRDKRTRRSPTPKKSPVKAQGKSSTTSSVPVKRYYGRRKEDRSSDEDLLSDGESSKAASGNSSRSGTKRLPGIDRGSTSKGGVSNFKDLSGPRLTPAEKLKKKMQAALNKQYKADKRAENERKAKVEEERMYREEELRAVASDMRRRRREKYGEGSQSDSSRSPSRSRSRSRSKSRSPPRPFIPEYDASVPPPPIRRGGYSGYRPRRPY